MPEPSDAFELYQLVGSALRDLAQSRFMSDLYSRQLSSAYERDPVLRRFPVPRVEIEEAELTLYFGIRAVQVDPLRSISNNATIGSLFGHYSTLVAADTVNAMLNEIESQYAVTTEPDAQKALTDYRKRIESDDLRELLNSRLFRYFNESTDAILDGERRFRSDIATGGVAERIDDWIENLSEPSSLGGRFQQRWTGLKGEIKQLTAQRLGELGARIDALQGKYPDYKILVDVRPEALTEFGASVSCVKIKTIVKNYVWSKVDVDKTDLRNMRTLSKED